MSSMTVEITAINANRSFEADSLGLLLEVDPELDPPVELQEEAPAEEVDPAGHEEHEEDPLVE
ncbi:hypothetical protein HK103_006283 [Boothiomyces macroporosus]|uniref:Uncharacterized protein n=1 Tax=Boothiomyces macroporosus TaxID=261099 RepID=A0AAD5Y775_9FUNG|nr:hypothetical protein HK103_006283 [Boothiomyces macroporosus]